MKWFPFGFNFPQRLFSDMHLALRPGDPVYNKGISPASGFLALFERKLVFLLCSLSAGLMRHHEKSLMKIHHYCYYASLLLPEYGAMKQPMHVMAGKYWFIKCSILSRPWRPLDKYPSPESIGALHHHYHHL